MLREYAGRQTQIWVVLESDPKVEGLQQERTFRDVVALQVMWASLVIGLLVYVQTDPVPHLRVLLTYFALSCLPFLGLWNVLWRRNSMNPGHLYSHGVRRYAQQVLLASLLIVCGAAASYWREILPGQGARLVASNEFTYLDNGEAGHQLVFEVPLEGSTRPQRQLNALLSEPTAKCWQFDRAEVYTSKERNPDTRFKNFGMSSATRAHHLVGYLLNAPPQTYWIVLLLEPRECAEGDRRAPISKEDVLLEILPQ